MVSRCGTLPPIRLLHTVPTCLLSRQRCRRVVTESILRCRQAVTPLSIPSNPWVGFSIPLNIIPSASSCPAPDCAVNINPLCPGTLRTAISENGLNLACMHPCNAGYGQETFGNRDCCTGESSRVESGSVSIGECISYSGRVAYALDTGRSC